MIYEFQVNNTKENIIQKKQPTPAPVQQKREIVEDEDFDDLPEGVLKIERSEKIIEEKGVKKKIITLTKYLEDGDIKKEL